MERDKKQNDDSDRLDPKVNTDFSESDRNSDGTLTQQESPDTDPNEVADKPTFKRSNS